MIFRDSILKALSTPLKAKIAAHFLSSPPKMSERELAKVLKISHMSVNRAVNEFAALNFLKSSRVGKVNLWEVIDDGFTYNTIKKLLSDFSEAIDPVSSLKNTIKSCLKGYNVEKAVLFGSVSKSKERPGSDIDLMIVTADEREKKKMEPAIEKLEIKCLELYGNPLSPYIMSRKEFEEKHNLPVVREAESGYKII